MPRSVLVLVAGVISAAALAPVGPGRGWAVPRDRTPPSTAVVDGDQERPTTNQNAVLGWRSPLNGPVIVDAKIQANENVVYGRT